MATSKPDCKYGSSCYRKNPDHLKQFSHPERDKAEEESGAKRRGRAKAVSSPGKPITDYFSSKSETPPAKRLKIDNECTTSTVFIAPPAPTTSGCHGDVKSTDENVDVREDIQRKFLVQMPEDFYQLWVFCKSVNSSQPEVALEPTLGLELVGPYAVLGGRLQGVSWESCILHSRYYFDPPELQTVLRRSGLNSEGYHIGYFRDDPKSTQCLVVSNNAKKGCEIIIEGDSLFNVLRSKLTEALRDKQTSPTKKALQELSSKLSVFMDHQGIPQFSPSLKELWKQRNKLTVAPCFHKIGIVVPYDKKTELGYRPLTMSNRDLRRLLDKIASCSNETERDQLFEPLQEIVTYVQFANDECDYGMGLELGLDLFCHGDQYFHNLIGHLLPIAYDLLQREQFGKICSEHLKHRQHEPLDFRNE